MSSQERQEDKALRDQIAQAIHERSTGIMARCADGGSCPYHRSLADAVLPVVQAHEKDLIEEIEEFAVELADERAVLSSLRSAVAQLADQLDDDVQAITDKDAGALGRRGGLRDAARLVRSLLPQEGPDKEGAEPCPD